MKKKLHGYYSMDAAIKCGSHIYNTPSGDQVEVTVVSEDPLAESYKWADKVYIGEVTTWAGIGVEDPNRRPRFYNPYRTR